MIKVRVNSKCALEYEYVCEVIFKTWSEIEYQFEIHDGLTEIIAGDSTLKFPCLLKDENLNYCVPLFQGHISLEGMQDQLPIFWGNPIVNKLGQETVLGCDIFAQIFYFITCAESLITSSKDIHGRDEIKNSFLVKNNLLEWPVVDATGDLIMFFVEKNIGWSPKLMFRSTLSTDIDHPFDASRLSVIEYLRQSKHDIFSRKLPKLWARRTLNIFTSQFNYNDLDPNNSFKYLADVADKSKSDLIAYVLNPLETHFNNGPYKFNGNYPKWLLKLLLENNFQIGLHGSYQTLNNVDLLKREKERLENEIRLIDSHVIVRSNRQHYLRWLDGSSPRDMQLAGFEIDSSVGSSYFAGFRSGTCRQYPLWDHREMKILKVKENPITFMEVTLLNSRSQKIIAENSIAKGRKLKETVMKYKGNFNVLWHQNRLWCQEERGILEGILN